MYIEGEPIDFMFTLAKSPKIDLFEFSLWIKFRSNRMLRCRNVDFSLLVNSPITMRHTKFVNGATCCCCVPWNLVFG